MSTTLAQDLADSLKSYSIDVKYWEPGSGDSFIFLGNREFLQQHWADLTPPQRQDLTKADNQVLAFAAKHFENEDDDDVRVLRMCIDVINNGGSKTLGTG